MRNYIFLILFFVILFPLQGQTITPLSTAPISDSLMEQTRLLDSAVQFLTDENRLFTVRQTNAMRVHRRLAYTTGGILLAANGMGLYHFLSMKNQGHTYRNEVGMSETNQQNGTQNVWQSSQSQSERVIHGGLVALGTIAYTATASIELALPNIRNSQSKRSKTALHRKAFYVHAGLMVSTIALGFVQSYALSEGKHEMARYTGIAHLGVGIAAPVSMLASGLIFKTPLEY